MIKKASFFYDDGFVNLKFSTKTYDDGFVDSLSFKSLEITIFLGL